MILFFVYHYYQDHQSHHHHCPHHQSPPTSTSFLQLGNILLIIIVVRSELLLYIELLSNISVLLNSKYNLSLSSFQLRKLAFTLLSSACLESSINAKLVSSPIVVNFLLLYIEFSFGICIIELMFLVYQSFHFKNTL